MSHSESEFEVLQLRAQACWGLRLKEPFARSRLDVFLQLFSHLRLSLAKLRKTPQKVCDFIALAVLRKACTPQTKGTGKPTASFSKLPTHLEFASSHPSEGREETRSEETEHGTGPGDDGAAVARHAAGLGVQFLQGLELCHLGQGGRENLAACLTELMRPDGSTSIISRKIGSVLTRLAFALEPSHARARRWMAVDKLTPFNWWR